MTGARSTVAAVEPTIVELPARHVAVIRIEGPVGDLPRMMGDAFDVTMRAVTSAGATFAGHPFARYLGFGERIVAEVGFPFSGTVTPTAPVYLSELPGGRTVMATHVGPYDAIGEAWEAIGTWMREHGLQSIAPPWEAYATGPEDPGPPVTEICFPVS